MKRTIILLAVAAAAATASAQDLSTEITVDRVVVPELHGMQRMSLMPTLLTPKNVAADISSAEYTGHGSLSNMLRTLAPAPWRMANERTQYRGYAGVGIFPGLNAAADAGYRFVDGEKTTVGAWLNYDGADYKYEAQKVRSHIGTLGAYAEFGIGGAGTLSVDASGMVGNVSKFSGGTVTNTAFEGNARWQGVVSNFSYDASLGGSYLHMGGPQADGLPGYGGPVRQAQLTFAASGGVMHSGEKWRWAGLDIDGAVLKTKGAGSALGLYHFTPYVRFEASDFRVRLGAKLSVGSGVDASTRVAPSVSLAYAPVRSLFAANVAFTGGESLNPVLGLFELDPFVSRYDYYGRTNMPVDIAGALHFGRLAGFGIDVRAGYASVRDLLLPDGDCTGDYAGWRANTWRVGADVSYAFRSLLIVGIGGDVAGSNNDEGHVSWHEWTDRAKAQMRAYVHATPLERLDVNVDFTWRHDRRSAYGSLGAIRSLDLSGEYRITPSLTASLSVCNLLCHRYLLVSGLPSQGLRGLAGVSYKF